MRRAVCIALLALLVGFAGCSRPGEQGAGTTHPARKQKRPIAITLLLKTVGGTIVCQAKFSGRANHAFDNDDIAWEVTNACTDPQTVTIAVKSGSPNPFTDPAGSWQLQPIQGGDTGDQLLTVGASIAPGVYGFDIIVGVGSGAKRYDPKLEIDP